EFPDLEVAFENDRAPVITDAGPEHAAIFELRHLPGLAGDLFRPNILCAAAIRNVEDGAVVLAPHGPHFFGAAFAELFITRLSAKTHQPDFAFIDVTMTFAPPLRAAKSMPGESHRAAVALWRTEVFGGVLVGDDLHRRAAIDTSATNIGPAVVATV